MTRHHPASCRSSTRWLLCVLALAIWVAGTLGFVHGSLHSPLRMAHTDAVSASSSTGSRQASSTDAQGEHGLIALFADHGVSDDHGSYGDGDCLLYDQLAHGPAAVCVPAVVLPLTLPTATFAYLEGESLARWVALFEARGPPSTR